MIIYSLTRFLWRILIQGAYERPEKSCDADHPFRVGEKSIVLPLVWSAAASVAMLFTPLAGIAEGGHALRTETLEQLVKPGLPLSSLARGEVTELYASPWVHSSQGDVRLISTVTGVGTGASIRLGLQFNLLPHWKIYWRTPGDVGYPPVIDWSGSQNLAGATFTWPAPQHFSLQGIETAGYEEEVVFPIIVTLVEPGSPLWVQAKIDFLACAEICVPQEIELELLVLDGPAEPSPFMRLVERHAARVPGDGKAVGLRLVAAATRPEQPGKEGSFIEVRVEANPPLATPELFIEGPEGLHAGTPRVWWSEDSQQITLQVPTRSLVAVGVPVTITLVDRVRSMEATVTLTASTMAEAFSETSIRPDTLTTLAVMLSLAFLGGLILNLMPCVLPVLSLKVLILIGYGGDKRQVVRWSFVASAAGILFSFLLLAVTAIAVKAAGVAVGWGIQFQQSLFLTVIVVVLTLFAANLWGLFELILPSWLTNLCSGSCEHGYTGAFLTGAFTTLLATPCSAPFLGTAVGFALARGPLEILLIFAGLGIGMALPYLLVAAFPALAACLPRPGRWMLWLKWFMGLALAATVVWLLTVLRVQVGEVAAILTGTAMATVIGILILRRHLPVQWRPLASVAVMLLTFLVIAVQAAGYPWQEPEAMVRQGPQDPWLPFDEDVIERHVAEGRVVFVDITADWCVTCQVNKIAVLSHGEVAARLGVVVAMRADWTRPDAKIAAYMARFGRYGIPFNAVYGPGAPQGLPLSELLTKEAVLQALDTAAGRGSLWRLPGGGAAPCCRSSVMHPDSAV